MSCNSSLFSGNSATQTVAVGGTINLGTPIRRFGKNINMSGGNVILNGTGYYTIDANFTIEGTAAGIATVTIYKDGVAIPNASASTTTADGTTHNLAIACETRVTCCCDAVLTAIVSGAAVDVTNAAIVVNKI